VQEREANLFAAQLLVAESLIKPSIKTLYPVFESFETRSRAAASRARIRPFDRTDKPTNEIRPSLFDQ
jgi:hypothetical protein